MRTKTKISQREIVQNFFHEVLSERSLDRLQQYVTNDVVLYTPLVPKKLHGIREFRRFFGELFEAVPEARIVINDIIYEQGKAMVRWTMIGRQEHSFRNLPPREDFKVCVVSLIKFSGDKIKEKWSIDTSFWPLPECS